MLTRYFSLLMGLAFVAAGIGGFLPIFAPHPPAGAPELLVGHAYGYLLGLFPINAVHNLLHLLIGVGGVLAYRGYANARRYCQALALLLGTLTFMGLLPGLNTLFGLLPLFGHDVWLHALEATLAAYFGFVARAPAGQKEFSHVH